MDFLNLLGIVSKKKKKNLDVDVQMTFPLVIRAFILRDKMNCNSFGTCSFAILSTIVEIYPGVGATVETGQQHDDSKQWTWEKEKERADWKWGCTNVDLIQVHRQAELISLSYKTQNITFIDM